MNVHIGSKRYYFMDLSLRKLWALATSREQLLAAPSFNIEGTEA